MESLSKNDQFEKIKKYILGAKFWVRVKFEHKKTFIGDLPLVGSPLGPGLFVSVCVDI